MKWDAIEYCFYCTFIVVLSWSEDGRPRPKHVAKYYVIVIIASCLKYVVYWRCIIQGDSNRWTQFRTSIFP